MRGIVRYLCYVAFIVILGVVVLLAATRLPEGLRLNTPVPGSAFTTSEFSIIEHLQSALLVACMLIYGWIASRDRLRRPLGIAFVTACMLALVRETDYFLDQYAVDNLWQVFAALIFAVSGVYLVRHRKRLRSGWRRSWPSGGLEIVFAGFLILVPFAQLVATDALWQSFLGTDYVRAAKLAAEELIELGGYAVITVGSLEFLHGWSLVPHTRTIDRPQRPRRR